MTANFFHIDDLSQGLPRELAEGVTTRIFPGDQAMLSVVRLEANAKGSLHSHPEEQWGYLIEGSATRIQDGEHIPVEKGSFWRTPSDVEHSVIAGPEGVLFWMYLHRRVKSIKQLAAVLAQTVIKPIW